MCFGVLKGLGTGGTCVPEVSNGLAEAGTRVPEVPNRLAVPGTCVFEVSNGLAVIETHGLMVPKGLGIVGTYVAAVLKGLGRSEENRFLLKLSLAKHLGFFFVSPHRSVVRGFVDGAGNGRRVVLIPKLLGDPYLCLLLNPRN